MPDIVYKKGGPHRGPKGIPYSYLGVDTDEALEEALKNGWCRTLPEAVLGEKPKEEEKKVILTPKVKFSDDTKKDEPKPKVESTQYKDLTDEDKRTIKDRLESGEKPGEIGKDYNMHHLVVVKVGRELD